MPKQRTPGKGWRADPLTSGLTLTGELLITVGVLFALLAVYSVWWTNVVADRHASAAESQLRQSWALPAGSGTSGDKSGYPLDSSQHYATGDTLGILHIPRLGKDFSVVIKMGTDLDVLNQGVAGVYRTPYQAAMPWAGTGNFAMAAHRDGHGAKFHNLPELRPGDKIVVETSSTWYIYTVANTLQQTSSADVGVVAPVPPESGFKKPGRYLTLTTCTPEYTSWYRMAVWATFTRSQAVDAARDVPAELR